MVRLKILASIWDDAFTEKVYDSRIVDYLIWRYDPNRQKNITGPVNPSEASGDVATESDYAFYTASFDTFTTDLANQLLPHTKPESVEQFFCLFYSGETDVAFEMLHGRTLASSDLRWYYQREMNYLRKEKPRPIFSFTSGVWKPEGDLLLVGDHSQFSFLVSLRKEQWIARIVLEVRPGRSAHPYLVVNTEGNTEFSDRWDNIYLGLELGREMIKFGSHSVDGFVGIGYDAVMPFWDEDLLLGTVNANAGFGYRYFAGESRQWVLGADYRFEAIGSRNSGGTGLSGGATTLRFSVGFSPDLGNGRRRDGLGH